MISIRLTITQWGKEDSSLHDANTTSYPQAVWILLHTTHIKMNSKLLGDIEATPIKFSGENIKIDLHDFDPGSGFLATSP